jgi:hypothetical protein
MEQEVDTRRCRCGHAKGDFWVRPTRKYGWWAVLGMMFGVSSRPVRIDYQCGRCGEVVESVSDRAELERFRYGPR